MQFKQGYEIGSTSRVKAGHMKGYTTQFAMKSLAIVSMSEEQTKERYSKLEIIKEPPTTKAPL